MSIQNIKAALFRYCEMSWPDLTRLKSWMRNSESFNTFDPENFSCPSVRVAVATNEQNQPIVFCPVEKILMVSAYAVSPNTSPSEARRAGDCLDAAIARQAQQEGISKLLIVIPKDHPGLPESEWEEVRSYTRKIPQTAAMHGIEYPIPQAARFLN